MANNLSQQKTAKIKFFAVYIVSVALIIIILAAFRKTEQLPPAAAAENEVGTTDNQLAQADALLHSRMSELDKLRLSAIQNPVKGGGDESAIQSAETNFILLLDSLEKQKTGLADEQQEALSSLLANFKNELQVKNLLHDSYGQVLKRQSAQPVSTDNGEAERLRSSLEEKEKTINLLQQQLARKPATVPQPTEEDRETKKKLASLKTAFDRLQEQNKNMERSYKVVVEDNRRLLTQLQSARKQ